MNGVALGTRPISADRAERIVVEETVEPGFTRRRMVPIPPLLPLPIKIDDARVGTGQLAGFGGLVGHQIGSGGNEVQVALHGITIGT